MHLPLRRWPFLYAGPVFSGVSGGSRSFKFKLDTLGIATVALIVGWAPAYFVAGIFMAHQQRGGGI